jgi:hypothetical protein
MSRLLQICDEDLSTLERTLPQLADALTVRMDNRLRVQLRQVQKILSDVRWNYGPPAEVEIIPTSDGQPS